MLSAHAQHSYSPAVAAPAWEAAAGESSIHNDNAWLLSFIDILALLLTLFVLLLAYESQGPDAGNAPRPLLQHQQPQAAVVAASEPAAAQSPAPLPAPIAPFRSLSPVLAGAEPSFIDLPVADLAPPRRHPAASKPAARTAPQPAHDTMANAEPNSSDTPAAMAQTSVDALLALRSDVADVPALNLITPAAASTVAASPLLSQNQSPVDPGVGLPVVLVAASADLPHASPQDTLLAALASSGLQDRIEVTVSSGAVNLEISDNILFLPASAALTVDGARVLAELAAAFAEQPYSLSVEGHTDNVPIRSARFPSNWELSSARATMVTRKLIERGVAADRVRAIGYGDTRPRADNATPEGRARNRRVSFVLQAFPKSDNVIE